MPVEKESVINISVPDSDLEKVHFFQQEERHMKKLPPVSIPIPVPEEDLDPNALYDDVIFSTEDPGGYVIFDDPHEEMYKPEPSKTYEKHALDLQPQFPGGEKTLLGWIHANLQFPEVCIDNGIGGLVLVKFKVDKRGRVTDIEIIKGVHPELDAEVMRVMEEMPDFTLAFRRGVPVDSYMRLPVKFVIQ